MRARRLRPGFTLLELLVVISIIIVLITLSVMFLPNLDRNKGVPNGATQVEGWIRLAKNAAIRDGAPRGVRLITDPNNPLRVTAMESIEQPDPVAPRGYRTVNPGGQPLTLVVALWIRTQPNAQPPAYPLQNPSIATLVYIDQTPGSPTYGQPMTPDDWDDPTAPQIFPGDFLELSGSPNAVARIMTAPAPDTTGYPYPLGGNGQRAQFQLDRAINGTDVNPLLVTDGFRIIRSPRPLAGEPPYQLHKDIYIDLPSCFPCPVLLQNSQGQYVTTGSPPDGAPYGNLYTGYQPWSLSPNGNIDILFNSNGTVANAPTGQLILAVRHVDRPNDMLFVVVYTRSGKVGVVQQYDIGGADPYSFARDGRGNGL